MDKWGKLLVDGVFTIAEMAAIGLDIEKDAFTSKLRDGPHLLAPTGCDLKRYNVGTIISGFHYGIYFIW